MPSTTNVKQSIRNYSSIGCRHALLCQSFCCANHTDRLQLMRLASTYQVDHAVIVSDLIPLKDAVQIFRTNRPIIVSAEPIEAPGFHARAAMAQRPRRRLSTSWPAMVVSTSPIFTAENPVGYTNYVKNGPTLRQPDMA